MRRVEGGKLTQDEPAASAAAVTNASAAAMMTNASADAISGAVTIISPCINTCRIDQRSGWCEGCRRTVDEIARWPLASAVEQAAILAELPGRISPRKRLGVRW